MSPYIELHFLFNPDLKKRFQSGHLRKQWRKDYPQLFTAYDEVLAENQPNKHFFEWLGAVLLFQSLGFESCLKWCNNAHPEKVAKFCSLAGKELSSEVLDWAGGHPDLLLYSKDGSDWFFCEVKGGPDKLRPNQLKAAKNLHSRTGRKVYLLNLHPH